MQLISMHCSDIIQTGNAANASFNPTQATKMPQVRIMMYHGATNSSISHYNEEKLVTVSEHEGGPIDEQANEKHWHQILLNGCYVTLVATETSNWERERELKNEKDATKHLVITYTQAIPTLLLEGGQLFRQTMCNFLRHWGRYSAVEQGFWSQCRAADLNWGQWRIIKAGSTSYHSRLHSHRWARRWREC